MPRLRYNDRARAYEKNLKNETKHAPLPGLTAPLRARYWPQYRYVATKVKQAAAAATTTAPEQKRGKAKTQVQGMRRGTAVDRLFGRFVQRFARTTLTLEHVVAAWDKRSGWDHRPMGGWLTSVGRASVTPGEWALFQLAVRCLCDANLQPRMTAVPVASEKAMLQTWIDIVCWHPPSGSLYLIEMKCGFAAYWRVGHGYLASPLTGLADHPCHQAHLQLVWTYMMAEESLQREPHHMMARLGGPIAGAFVMHVHESAAMLEPMNTVMHTVMRATGLHPMTVVRKTQTKTKTVATRKPQPRRRSKTPVKRRKKTPPKRRRTKTTADRSYV